MFSTLLTVLTVGVASVAAVPAPATTAAPAATGNPFSGKQIYANPYYASEINNLAIPSLPASQQAQASAVAKVGTFQWL